MYGRSESQPQRSATAAFWEVIEGNVDFAYANPLLHSKIHFIYVRIYEVRIPAYVLPEVWI